MDGVLGNTSAQAVVVISTKPGCFIAGADIGSVASTIHVQYMYYYIAHCRVGKMRERKTIDFERKVKIYFLCSVVGWTKLGQRKQ